MVNFSSLPVFLCFRIFCVFLSLLFYFNIVNVNVNVNQEFLTWLKQPELLRSPRKRSAEI